MTDAYRACPIGQRTHFEIVGQPPDRNWITRAPTLARMAILLAKAQAEAGHGLYLYCAAETLRDRRDGLIEARHQRRMKYSLTFYPPLNWPDGAPIMNRVQVQRTSYGPYARAMGRTCKAESFHRRQGNGFMM